MRTTTAWLLAGGLLAAGCGSEPEAPSAQPGGTADAGGDAGADGAVAAGPDAAQDAGSADSGDGGSAADGGSVVDAGGAGPGDVGVADAGAGAVDAGLAMPAIQLFDLQMTPALGLVAVLAVTTDVPTTLTGTVTDTLTGAKAPFGPLGPATSHAAVLAHLAPGRAYTVHATADSGGATTVRDGELVTPGLPDELPAIVVHASDPGRMAPGLTYVGLRNTVVEERLTVALDETGAIVRYWLGWDASTVLPEGDLLGITGPGALCQASPLGATVFCADPAPLGTPLFHHHPSRTPEGTYLVLGVEMDTIAGYPDGTGPVTYNVVGDVVYELAPPGTQLRRFGMLERLDPYLVGPVFESPYWDIVFPGLDGGTHDWSHGNAVVHDPSDDTLIVTLLGLSQVVKLDRETGAVRWRLGPGGDLHLLEGDYCRLLHHAAPTGGGRILTYCNQPASMPWESAAVEYQLETPEGDPDAWTATEVWRHAVQPPVTTRILGEAHALENGNVLIVDAAVDLEEPSGGQLQPSALWGRVVEVSPEDHEEVFRVDVLPSPRVPAGYLISGVARAPDPFAAGVP